MSKSKKHKHKTGHDAVATDKLEEELFDLDPYEKKMDVALEHYLHELMAIRTGRVSPALLDGVVMEAYGTKQALHHHATVVAQGPRLLAVTVYDKSLRDAAVQAIQNSPLELTPRMEGSGNILVPVPEMSHETQKAMIKLAHKEAEDARIIIRKHRGKAMTDLKGKGKSVSDDQRRMVEGDIEELTKRYIAQIDQALANKEKDLEG